MNKKKIIGVTILITAVFLAITLFYYFHFFRKLDHMVYDSAVKFIRLNKSTADRVAVILIEEASLETLNPIVGRWPWPRAIYSDLLDFLSMGEPAAVLFDILFTENQKDVDSERLGHNDGQLVRATQEAGNVYHAMQLLIDKEINRWLQNRPLPRDFIERFPLKDVQAYPGYKHEYTNYCLPFKELYSAAYGMGIVEFLADSDGVFRRTKPIREYGGEFLPVMGVAPVVDSRRVEIAKNQIIIGDRQVPVDNMGKYILNFYGKYNTYSISGIFASLQKIMQGDIEGIIVDPMEFKDKIVFIGASAVGVEDLKPTPIAARTPGVFLHATLASNFLLNDFLVPPDWKITLLTILLFTMLCMTGIIYIPRFWSKIIFPFAVILLWVAFFLFQLNHNVLYELVPPLAAIILSSMLSFGYLVATEGREKLRVKRMFSQYVSPEVVAEITKNTDFSLTDKGRKKDLTILFTDIRNFTSFSDSNSPERVVEMLNLFFSNMSRVIFSSQGTIDKFIGDSIMAFWGAPLKVADHPDRAVETALNMLRELNLLNGKLEERGFDLYLRIGIGINSGEAILGNIGSESKLNYTIVGDAVNLASRLEGLTKTYGCQVIISESTYRRLQKDIPCRVIDELQVRGRQEITKIYEPLSVECAPDFERAKEICDLTNRAFAFYQKGDYEKAQEMYLMIEDGKVKEIFLTRCREKLKDNRRETAKAV